MDRCSECGRVCWPSLLYWEIRRGPWIVRVRWTAWYWRRWSGPYVGFYCDWTRHSYAIYGPLFITRWSYAAGWED